MKSKKKEPPLKSNSVRKLLEGITDSSAEQQLYALLHEKYGHTDPYNHGIDRMTKLVDALLKFLGNKYSGNHSGENHGNFNGLIPKNIQVEFTDKKTIDLSYRMENGRCIVILPKIADYTPEQEGSREVQIAERFASVIPSNIYNIIERIIRGMPENARENLLNQYGDVESSKE